MTNSASHGALYTIFFLSYLIRTFITCIALEKIIRAFSVDQLAVHYAAACAVTLLGSCALVVTPKIGPRYAFGLVHSVMLAAAVCVLAIQDAALQSQIIFYSALGFGLLVYVTNWHLASFAVSPFQAPRVFKKLSKLNLAGMVAGAIFAMNYSQNSMEHIAFPLWASIEAALILISYFGTKSPSTGLEPHQLNILTPIRETFRVTFKRYFFLRKLIAWLFFWGFVYTIMHVNVAEQFAERTTSLASLYGALILVTTALSSFWTVFLYPTFVRWYRLGGMLTVCSVIASALAIAYSGFPIFSVAVVLYVCFEMLNNSMKAPALDEQLNLYPGRYRYHFRLLIEVAVPATGGMLVALTYLIPFWASIAALIGITLISIWLALRSGSSFNEEVMSLLVSPDEQERRNAIDLYDHLEHQDQYEQFLRELIEGKDLSTNINILRTFASLKTHKPLPEILDMIEPEMDNSMRIAVLRYIDELNFEKFDPFLHYRTLEVLKDICLHCNSNVSRAMAIKTFVQRASPEISVSFVIDELNSEDDRVVANAIDGLSHLTYPGVVHLLEPYLKHETPRIKANTIVALWKYPKSRFRVRAAITSMLYSENIKHTVSAIYAAGKVNDSNYVEFIKSQLPSEDPGLQRIILIALLNLGETQYIPQVVDLMLGDNEPQGINTCYLSLGLSENILNEGIIATIYHRGQNARDTAISRFSRSGAFCREQIHLLSGKTISSQKLT
ncbi:MAG: hypothetical protein HOI23_13390 [Deltaproteobacteria bacterium]|nr:hypothetical protein [Deltaproteobacteria bacterium]MBT6434487.1 hypothetical protein [Deltaproteobacteria bacterium]MBT6491608.1 hypothetical protein [Deltaproteobacteria bacterium]